MSSSSSARCTHAGLDGRPLARLDQQRQQFQRPGPAGHAGVAEDVVRDAVVPDALRHLAHAAVQVVGRSSPPAAAAGLGKSLPGRAQHAAAAAQFVPHPRLGRQRAAGQRVRRRVLGARSGSKGSGLCEAARRVSGRHGRRRSRVNGNSRLGAAGATSIVPGVWPKRKKRARRRLSAV